MGKLIGFGCCVGHVVVVVAVAVAIAVGTGAGVVSAAWLVWQSGCLVLRICTLQGWQLCGG